MWGLKYGKTHWAARTISKPRHKAARGAQLVFATLTPNAKFGGCPGLHGPLGAASKVAVAMGVGTARYPGSASEKQVSHGPASAFIPRTLLTSLPHIILQQPPREGFYHCHFRVRDI